MKKYLNILTAIFLFFVALNIFLTILSINNIKKSLHHVISASESLKERDILFQDVEIFIKTPLPKNLQAIKDTVANCYNCHHSDKNITKIDKIKNLVKLIDNDINNKVLHNRLHELALEAATAGKELVSKRSAEALSFSDKLLISYMSTIGFLLIMFAVFSYMIIRGADRTISRIIKATQDVSRGISVDKNRFTREFKPIGEAFEHLQQDLKIKEEKLTNWAKNWKLAFDSIDEMMALCDVNGIVVIASRSLKEKFGEEIEGKFIFDIICKRFKCDEECLVRTTLKTGEVSERILSDKGLVLSVKTYPLLDKEGNINGCIWVGRDITKEKEYEERALQSEKLIALGELVAGIAHEINNPLSVVVGYAEIMLHSNQLSDIDRKRLEKIFQSGTRAANIITNLLEFARRRAPEQTPCNLNVIADKIVDLIHYELKSDGIKLIRNYTVDLPTIMGDKTQLGQVILNILKNAHDAIMETDNPGEIEIKTYYDDEHVYLDIIDNGPGIPEENLHRIFEPFFTTKDIGKGTGLGLSITYSIVKAHGGDIVIKNREEGGIIVHISLPRGNGTGRANGKEYGAYNR